MTAKRDAASKAEQQPAPERAEGRNFGPHECLIRTTVQNTATMHHWGKQFGVVDVSVLAMSLNEAVSDVVGGNMQPAETMLMGQAMALQTIFTELSARAARADTMTHLDTYMRLALKAQAQCRASLEALAAIKSPPILFARQANFANGPQQVNNGAPAPAVNAAMAPRASESNSRQNELLENQHGQWLDSGTQGQTRGGNSALAPVGIVDRAAERGG